MPLPFSQLPNLKQAIMICTQIISSQLSQVLGQVIIIITGLDNCEWYHKYATKCLSHPYTAELLFLLLWFHWLHCSDTNTSKCVKCTANHDKSEVITLLIASECIQVCNFWHKRFHEVVDLVKICTHTKVYSPKSSASSIIYFISYQCCYLTVYRK